MNKTAADILDQRLAALLARIKFHEESAAILDADLAREQEEIATLKAEAVALEDALMDKAAA